MGKSGGSPQTGIVDTPYQQMMRQYMTPLLQQASNFAMANTISPSGMPITTSMQPTPGSYSWIDPTTGPAHVGRLAADYRSSISEPDIFDPSSTPYYYDAFSGGMQNFLNQANTGIPYRQYSHLPSGLQNLMTKVGTGTSGGEGSGTSGGIAGAGSGQLWPIPTYNIPNPEYMMPTANTMNAISPEVWSGIMQPYQKVEQQLMETLGAGGVAGSARGGFSGEGAAGLGKYWSEAAPGIGQQAWGMVSPALQQGWSAELQKNQALWGEQLQQFKYPWQAAPSYMSMAMPTPYAMQPGESGMSNMSSFIGAVAPIAAAAIMASDRRFKKNIIQIGTSDGIPVYKFQYKGEIRKRIGPIAQDLLRLRPEAVIDIGGYLFVNMEKL